MADGATLLKKLQAKPGTRLTLHNVPKDIEKALTAGGDVKPVKDGAACDGVIAFCESPDHVEEFAKRILAKSPDDALVWFAYRKGAAAKESGLNRDTGWAPLSDVGWRPVRSISFDDEWTGLRFRPQALVKSKS